MFTPAPGLQTAVAVALAVLAALCFAFGGFLQQQAVRAAVQISGGGGAAAPPAVDRASFRRLAGQPRWLAGWALVGGGSVLHVSALLLAPVSVVQPIGILAVPASVLLVAHARRALPHRLTVAGVALAVAGTAAFVLLAGSGSAAGWTPVSLDTLLTVVLAVAAAVAGLAWWARGRSGLVRCLGYASVGATSFGFGSGLIHLIGQAVATNGGMLLSPLVIAAGLATASALAFGAWAVQQAYASGPAAVVTGALTVGDPLVAVLLSAGLLGGGLNVSPVVLAAMIGSALIAATGVRLLAGDQPTATSTAAPRPTPEPALVHAGVQ